MPKGLIWGVLSDTPISPNSGHDQEVILYRYCITRDTMDPGYHPNGVIGITW